MIAKLRTFIESRVLHADRFDRAEATDIFYNQAFGALMFAVDAHLLSEGEALNLWDVEFHDTWVKLFERTYGK